MAPSRFARLWAFGRRAQAIHHQAVYRYDTDAVEKSRQNRTSRRPCQISPTEKELTIPFHYLTEMMFCCSYIKSAQSVRIAHSVFERSVFTKSSQSSQSVFGVKTDGKTATGSQPYWESCCSTDLHLFDGIGIGVGLPICTFCIAVDGSDICAVLRQEREA